MIYAYANKTAKCFGSDKSGDGKEKLGDVKIVLLRKGSFALQITEKGYDINNQYCYYGYRDASGIEYHVKAEDVDESNTPPINKKIVIPNKQGDNEGGNDNENKDGDDDSNGDGGNGKGGIGSGDGLFNLPLWAIGLIVLVILK